VRSVRFKFSERERYYARSKGLTLHASPLAAAAGKRDIQEKEDEEEEHKEEEKRTCEMWQLKLSSGGGTYGIHFCVVFDDDWSFKPKNIAVVVVVK
jgi:hypothetical protein